ncbi:MAG: mechanosensitive ion channel family protein [Myxococcaceae bacterium]
MRFLLLAALLQWPLGSEDSSPAGAPAPASEVRDAGPAAILLPEVLRAAEKAHGALKSMAKPLADRQLIEEVQQGLPTLVSSIDPLTGKGPLPPKRDLSDVRPALQRADDTLSAWDEGFESAVRAVYENSQELQRMDEVWSLTEAQARKDGAPTPVLEGIAALRASIDATAAQARTQLGQLLTAQNQVATVRMRIADALARVKEAEALEAEQLFEVESVPFWKLLSRPTQVEKVRQQIKQTLRTHATALKDFVRGQSTRVLVLLGFLVVLTLALWRGRERLEAERASDPSISTVVDVLRHPFATAVLLVLTAAMVWLQPRPVVVSQVLLLGMLAAFFAAAQSLIPARARRSAHALGILVAIHTVSSLAPDLSLLRRVIMLAVSLSATAVLVGELRRRGWEAEIASKRWRSLFRAALIAGTILLLGSLVANLVGNMALARLLASGTLYSGALLLLLSGVFQVLRGLWVIVLRSPRVSGRPLFADNVELFQQRGTNYLRWAVGLLWLFATVRLFRIDTPIWETVQRVVSWRARTGSLDLSLGDVLAFAVTLWIAVLLGRLVGFVLSEGLKTRGLGRGVHTAISRTATYAVVAVGMVIAVLASGTELTRLTVLIGTLGVGIGFGLQDVVNNFVSGLILLYERPVQVGDVIEVGEVMGTVRRIGIRSSTVATEQGSEVVVPNAHLISNEVINWTLSDNQRRTDIDVAVAEATVPERVRELLLQVAVAHPEVLKAPEPLALFAGFGNSALNFQLQIWTREEIRDRVASEVRTAIGRVLGGAGIHLPQNEVHLVAVDPSVQGMLVGRGEADRPSRTDTGKEE